ncbi:PAS domain S-box protein [Ferrovibrio sp.]|uniref:PAS domain S-box protein n=1 Tax=Ferrovibrio sp. TaxID=1917215 RepID=UPI003D0D16E0
MAIALNATLAERRLALQCLVVVCVLMTLGSCYGLFVAGPAGLLSPFEWLTIPPMLLTGLVMLGLLLWRGTIWLERIAFGLSIWISIYIAGNVANALFLTKDGDKVFIHMGWAIPVYLFMFAVNERKRALWLSGLTAGSILISVGTYLAEHAAAGSSQLDAMVSWSLAQLAALALIAGVSHFRELYAIENAAAAALADSNSRISALAERLSESEARARRLIDLAPDVPGLLDDTACVIEIGPNCRDIWGMEREAIIGRPLASLFSATDQLVVTARLDAARGGAPRRMQPGQVRHANGQEKPVLWSVIWSPVASQYYLWAQPAE